ncbi:hypothetical protein BZA70DRAFT_280025 [Myxozyma melibiosi]|uniref:FAR1 domain-containing protein n=1 Tax=Myxozyma melibiosi TaxID=54550 RepID=A0ABR1F4Q0_9ASCO
MDITDFASSISPVHLDDPALSVAASHLGLTSTLSPLPSSDEAHDIIHHHPHHHHHRIPVHPHNLHSHVIDHQLQQLQERQEQAEIESSSHESLPQQLRHQTDATQTSQDDQQQHAHAQQTQQTQHEQAVQKQTQQSQSQPQPQQQQQRQQQRQQQDESDSAEPADVDFSALAASLLVAPDEKLDLTQTFPSKDALLLHLNRYATVAGFRLSRTSSRPEHIRIQCWKRAKTSKYTRKDDDNRKRRASYGTTRSTDCPFFLNCWHHKKSGCWYIKSSNILHNHEFSQDLISQKSLTNEEKNLLKDLSYAGPDLSRNIPVKIINAKRRERGVPDVDPKLVSNALAKFRQAREDSEKLADMDEQDQDQETD